MDEQPGDIVGQVKEVSAAAPRSSSSKRSAPAPAAAATDRYARLGGPKMSIVEAHELSHRVKDAVRARNASVVDVLVHIEPAR